ncbi:MAG TPA: hypothetical protein VN950_27870 [Terriglobales bacterium]|nr:hypothetical protein [Terriglobales bacterium]
MAPPHGLKRNRDENNQHSPQFPIFLDKIKPIRRQLDIVLPISRLSQHFSTGAARLARRQAQRPYYTVALAILEPSRFSGHIISSRLYCNPKALWKLKWFLRDFGYDVELLGRDEVDESQLIGLTGVVKISHIIINGASLLRLDGFAPAGGWEELSPSNLDGSQVA